MLKNVVKGADIVYLLVYLAVGSLALGTVSALYRGLNHRDPYGEASKFDPRLGTLVTLPLSDAGGHRVDSHKRHLLVFLGACTSCSVHSFERAKLKLAGDITPVLVLETPPADIPNSLKRLDDTNVLGDPDRKLAGSVNATWIPRMVLLGQKGDIVWLQPTPGAYIPGVAYEK